MEKKKAYEKPRLEKSSFSGAEMKSFDGSCGVTAVFIPEQVSSIKEGAFRGCRQIRSVIISKGVDRIEREAFLDCGDLTIYCEAKTQPIGWDKNWNSSKRPVYWYSEEEPALNEEGTAYEGNFWKYNKNGEVVLWEKGKD